ncbi:MAG: 2-dehydropantoate 2-reductase [Alphaproteobacteria bacterium]|nr:2-dehydropantoate 2-reductase [Alphaproteobacteria bacterium]
MSRVIVIGPGAIGCTVGGALLREGHDVIFCGRRPFDHLRVHKDGEVEQAVPAHVLTTAAGLTPGDWLLVCVKAHQVTSAVEWLRLGIAADTKVAVLQNGVEQRENVEPFVAPRTPIVPVVVDLPATRMGPGHVVWRRKAKLSAPDDADGRAFCMLFRKSFIEATSTDDFVTMAWRKLCLNAPDGAILTLTGQPRRVWHKPGIADLGRAILRECIAVGRAEGAKIDESLIEPQIISFLSAPPDEGNSMYIDRMAGRETEWNARNGVIVRKAAKHDIAVPVSAALAALLAAQEARLRPV